MTRPPDIILGELRVLHGMQAEAHVVLGNVRREQLKLASFEASVLLAIDGRGQKIDKLLDEYGVAVKESAC